MRCRVKKWQRMNELNTASKAGGGLVALNNWLTQVGITPVTAWRWRRNGWLKTGWFGGVMRDGAVRGYDPATGAENGTASAQLAGAASAAVAFAIAKGDMRRVGDFARGVNIQGLVRPITQ